MEKILFADHHAEHNADFIYHLPNGHDCWLLILTKTPADIQVNGLMQRFNNNHAVLFHPGQPLKYAACSESYINGWVRFHVDPDFFVHCPIEYGMPLPMADYMQCHQLMQLIAYEHHCGNTASSIYLLKGLLSILTQNKDNGKHSMEERLLNLRQEMKCNPGYPWTATYISGLVNLSEGHFHRMYKKLFGRSCMDDVIAMRLELAQALLKSGHMKINKVARQCGYKNVEHFCRQFRGRLGVSPQQYQSNPVARDYEKQGRTQDNQPPV